MTNQEQMTLTYLAGLRERIECGAFRIVESNIFEKMGEPLRTGPALGQVDFSMKTTIELELEYVPEAKRVPLQIKTNV